MAERFETIRERDPALVDAALAAAVREMRVIRPRDSVWQAVYRCLLEQAVHFLVSGYEESAERTCMAAHEVAMLDGSAGWVEWAKACENAVESANIALEGERYVEWKAGQPDDDEDDRWAEEGPDGVRRCVECGDELAGHEPRWCEWCVERVPMLDDDDEIPF